MSGMVERVAAKILADLQAQADAGPADSNFYVDGEPQADGRWVVDGRFDLASLARAAIEAMEPFIEEQVAEARANGYEAAKEDALDQARIDRLDR